MEDTLGRTTGRARSRIAARGGRGSHAPFAIAAGSSVTACRSSHCARGAAVSGRRCRPEA
eukprot:5279087-Alexandrium_andersonii.AAC.1